MDNQLPLSPNLLSRAPECRLQPPNGYAWTPPPFRLALAYHSGDSDQCLRLLDWIADLSPCLDRELVIFVDEGSDAAVHAGIVEAASRAFAYVTEYWIPRSGAKWPGSNNWVFAKMVGYMAGCSPLRPWLLLETDLAPATPRWLERLEEEYTRARRPFMGSYVCYYDILNGAAVYPPQVGVWAPAFFNSDVTRSLAYDCAIAPNIIEFSHDASHLMRHVWFSRQNGRPHGAFPRVPEWTQRMVDWVVDHNTCLVHRCKDPKLIQLLRAKLRIPSSKA